MRINYIGSNEDLNLIAYLGGYKRLLGAFKGYSRVTISLKNICSEMGVYYYGI